MKLPSAILFDLYETLITEYDPSWEPPAVSDADRLGLNAKQMKQDWQALRAPRMQGEIDYLDTLKEICRRQNAVPEPAVMSDLYEQRLQLKLEAMQTVDPRITTLIQALHAKGVRLALVSNADALEAAGWLECELQPYFEYSVFSHQVGTMKPNRRIYTHALDLLGVKPMNAAFVGDGGSEELHGALAVGLRPYFASWFLDAWPANKQRSYIEEQGRFPRIRHPGDLKVRLQNDFTSS